MPITLKKDVWKVKDPSSGQYRGAAILSTTLPQDAAQIISESNATIQNIKDTAIDAVDTALNDESTGLIPKAEADRDAIDDSLNNATNGIIPTAQSDRDDIDDSLNNIEDGIIPEAQANLATIAAAVQSQIGQGTDKTLSVAKGFADAKAAGMMVKVSNYQPGSQLDDPRTSQDASQNTGYPVYKDSNRVWVKETYAELEVPTTEDVDELKVDRDNGRLFQLEELCGPNLYTGGDLEKDVTTSTYQKTVVEIPLPEAGEYCIYYRDAIYTDVGYTNHFALYTDNTFATKIVDLNTKHQANFTMASAGSVYLKIQWTGSNVPAAPYHGSFRGIKVCKQKYTGKIPASMIEHQTDIDTADIVDHAVTPIKTSFMERDISYNLYNPINTGKYLYTDGNLRNNASYNTSDYIPVEEGDVVHYQFTYVQNNVRYDDTTVPNYRKISFVAGYNVNKVFVTGSYTTGVTSYTVPEGVSYLRVTLSINADFTDHAIFPSDDATVVPYKPFGVLKEYVKITDLPVDDNSTDNNHLWSAEKINGLISNVAVTDLALNGDKVIQSKNTGASITINVPQFKKNIVIGYLGFFSSWSDLYIYQGKTTGFTGMLCKITSSAVEIWRMDKYNSDDPSVHQPSYSASHDISSLADYISVVISETNNNACKVYICSNGETYTSPEWQWGGSRKDILVEHGSASWMNILSWGSTDFLERTWLYGDSYFDHWLRKIIERGNKAFVDDGYSGGSSANGLASFQLAIMMGCPHTVVWCLGMNDADNGAINSNWKNAIDTVKTICDQKGIDLIVATIPNVPGTNGNYRDHSYKNAYIKSNFNYIDVAEYVGASVSAGSSTTWYSGLLSSDGVHPSSAGDFYIANVMQTFLPDLRDS